MKKANKRKANNRNKPRQRKQQRNWRKWLKIGGLVIATLLAALAVLARAYHFFSVHIK